MGRLQLRRTTKPVAAWRKALPCRPGVEYVADIERWLPLLSLLQTHSLTGGKCVLLASGSKCKTTLPYWQYCEWWAARMVRCAARSLAGMLAAAAGCGCCCCCMHAHPLPPIPPCPPAAGAQCDAAGTKCLSCNGSRSPPTGVTDGRCALPCKQLFGIGCKTCNQTKCLTTDPKYAQGGGGKERGSIAALGALVRLPQH